MNTTFLIFLLLVKKKVENFYYSILKQFSYHWDKRKLFKKKTSFTTFEIKENYFKKKTSFTSADNNCIQK